MRAEFVKFPFIFCTYFQIADLTTSQGPVNLVKSSCSREFPGCSSTYSPDYYSPGPQANRCGQKKLYKHAHLCQSGLLPYLLRAEKEKMERKKFYEARKAQLEKEIEKLHKEIERYPKGTLVISSSKSKPQWFVQRKDKDGSFNRSYIRRNNLVQAKKLARKTYSRAVLLDKQNELHCIERYLKSCKETDFRRFLQISSPYRELLVDIDWEREPYEKNTKYPEQLTVPTKKGEMVRSKSEGLIADEMLSEGIAYRYECKLILDGVELFPDFTIKSRRNQRLIIWEHFGRIDDPKYVAKTARKLRLYLDNGYIPGVNLIMTFEDKKHPLAYETVREAIERYLI